MILLITLYFQFVVTPCSYVYWLLFGKHRLTSAEKEYNGKIEEICARLDAKYAECVGWLSETARQSHGQYTDEIEEDMQVLHNIDIMPMIAGMIEAEFGINPFSRIHVGPGKFRVQMPGTLLYSEAKKTLDDEFDAMNLSEKQKLRAMEKVNETEKINGPEYEFALGGRSECFLLQTRLRETKYEVDKWRSPMDMFWR